MTDFSIILHGQNTAWFIRANNLCILVYKKQITALSNLAA